MRVFATAFLALSICAFAAYLPGESDFPSLDFDHGMFGNPAGVATFDSWGFLGDFGQEEGVYGARLGAHFRTFGAAFDYESDGEGFDEARWSLTQGAAFIGGMLNLGHRAEAFRSADFDGTEFSYSLGVIVRPFPLLSLGYFGQHLLYFGPENEDRSHDFGATLKLGDLSVSYALEDFEKHRLLATMSVLDFMVGFEVPLYGNGKYALSFSRTLGGYAEAGVRFGDDYLPHRFSFAYHRARNLEAYGARIIRVPLATKVKEVSEKTIPFLFEPSLGIHTVRNHVGQLLQIRGLDIVIFDFTGYSGGWAVSKEIQRGIVRLRRSGKFVVAFLDDVRPSTLIAASGADRIVAEPSGRVTFRGFGGSTLFYKGLLSKIGVNVELLRHGEYKSAVERFTADSMSVEARSDLERVYKARWEILKAEWPATKRERLEEFANKALLTVGAAVEAGIVDTALYLEQVATDAVRVRYGRHVPYVYAAEFAPSTRPVLDTRYSMRRQIGLITIEGTITDATARAFNESLDELVSGDYEALVLRINSPGGSAQASDRIWASVRNLVELGFPVVASIGDYGASGGYYIACGANKIVAEEFSLVGSIGIYGGKVDASGLLQKLGIKAETVKTHAHADGETFTRPLDAEERASLQAFMDDFYDRFLGVVSGATGIAKEKVDSDLGGGRVFVGKEALENGLVAQLGGLDVAIAEAARLAGISFGRLELVSLSDDYSYILGAPRASLSSTLSEFTDIRVWALDIRFLDF